LGQDLEPKVRSWFLRNAVDALERAHGTAARERLRFAVPQRLAHLVSAEAMRATAPQGVILLEDAEDVLFAADAVVGQGAGTIMESIALEVVARAVAADGGASVVVGDLIGTVLGLRPVLESPFVDAAMAFELNRTAEGFTLMLGVAGRPRAARLLRHFAIGAIHAAARYAREAGAGALRVSGENFVDRAFISVVQRERAIEVAGTPPPAGMRARGARATLPPVARLTDEVERILSAPRESTPPPSAERVNGVPPLSIGQRRKIP